MTQNIETPTPTSVFHVRNKSPKDTLLFLDDSGSVDISRSDIVKYPIFKSQAEVMFSNFWKPHEIVLTQDNIEFNNSLEFHERFIFTANLKRQIMLDSIQSMAMSQALLPICSDPMVKRCINFIEFFEELHAQAYEHIVLNVFNDPTSVFDEMREIEQLVSAGKDIARYYDDLIHEIAKYRLGKTTKRNVKVKLWLCLNSINALEGIRFFGSFSNTFAFGNTGRMMGNVSEMRLIANDELLHQAFTTALIRTLPKDDPEYVEIEQQCRDEVIQIFKDTEQQEKDFTSYKYQYGSLIGMNAAIECQYLSWITAKRMKAIHLPYFGEAPKTNPIPWMNKFLNEGDTQNAPQETELTGYIQNVQADVDSTTFSGFSL